MTDELFDIVNEQDQVIGQEMRSKVHRLGLWHRGAHVLLFTPEEKLIVQQRSKTKSQSPLMFDCSVSEHVQAGETYHHAAIRGLQEELGITDISIQPLVKFKMNYGPNDNEISTLFKGVSAIKQVRFDPQEIEQVEAYTMEELRSLLSTRPDLFSYWFGQIMSWFLEKPSALQIMNNR